MRVAIIDLGTNTFNLLIAEVKGKTFIELFEKKLPVKLGEGGINKKTILPAAFKRGINTIEKYEKIIKKYQTNKTIAFATSAIREASNGQSFIKEIKKRTAIKVNIITGNQEAELIYHGVRKAVKMSENKSLIIDIGGGSIEFIIANKNKLFWKKSFLLGVARLMEQFKPSDPIKESEIEKIEAYLLKKLHTLFITTKKHRITELIGSSGSFESLAEMIAYRSYPPKILKGKTEYKFDLGECAEIYKIILKSNHAERLKTKGLIRMRADMIVLSSIFVNLIIRKLNIKKMRLSTFSLKEGAISELQEKQGQKTKTDVKNFNYRR